ILVGRRLPAPGHEHFSDAAEKPYVAAPGPPPYEAHPRRYSDRNDLMRYRIAPLFCRPWTLSGISPRLIESHYENNYGGALARLHAIAAELEGPAAEAMPAEAVGRLKRDEATALNSLLLHEVYFASLGGDGRAVPDAMSAALTRDFGSVDRWRREFVALATALAGGS